MAYIYKITNQINGKIYVGKTLTSIEARWKEHIRDAKKVELSHRPLYNAIRKYGVENFIIEQLEECSAESVNERECFWIESLNSYKHGYNATRGGDGAQYADYNLIFSLYKENKTFKQISSLTGYDNATIRKALEQNGISKEERLKNNIAHRLRAVAKLDPVTEEIIEVYSSIGEAENKNGNTRHISEVCNGKRKTCKGFKWKFL